MRVARYVVMDLSFTYGNTGRGTSVQRDLIALIMDMQLDSETVDLINPLTRLSARETFTEYHIHCVKFTEYHIHCVKFTEYHIHCVKFTEYHFHCVTFIQHHFNCLTFIQHHFHYVKYTEYHFHCVKYTEYHSHCINSAPFQLCNVYSAPFPLCKVYWVPFPLCKVYWVTFPLCNVPSQTLWCSSHKLSRVYQNTYFMFSNFFSENRTVYVIMSKNVIETEEPQMTSQYAAYALRAGLPRLHARMGMHTPTRLGTHIHARTHRPISNTHCFSTAAMIRERASILRYTHITCLVIYHRFSFMILEFS